MSSHTYQRKGSRHDQEPRDMAHGRASKMKARGRTRMIDEEEGGQWVNWVEARAQLVVVLFSVSILFFFFCLAVNCKNVKRETVPETKAKKINSVWT